MKRKKKIDDLPETETKNGREDYESPEVLGHSRPFECRRVYTEAEAREQAKR